MQELVAGKDKREIRDEDLKAQTIELEDVVKHLQSDPSLEKNISNKL